MMEDDNGLPTSPAFEITTAQCVDRQAHIAVFTVPSGGGNAPRVRLAIEINDSDRMQQSGACRRIMEVAEALRAAFIHGCTTNVNDLYEAHQKLKLIEEITNRDDLTATMKGAMIERHFKGEQG